MIPAQQQRPRAIISASKKLFRLDFWQGYLFAFGIGAIFIETLRFFKDRGDFEGIFYPTSTVFFWFSLIYPMLTGYAAGAIWRTQRKVWQAMPIMWRGVLLAIPLACYEFFRIVLQDKSEKEEGIVTIFFWVCLVLRVVFITWGVALGVKKKS
jgi:phosphoglycerol transferase MdoB-like AlkP superfamily enzyme